jgi:hypothetical protein
MVAAMSAAQHITSGGAHKGHWAWAVPQAAQSLPLVYTFGITQILGVIFCVVVQS